MSMLCMRLLVSNVICLLSAHCIKYIISVQKALIEHFKKFNFNKMLSAQVAYGKGPHTKLDEIL